jgi:hypothetical protein
MGAPASATGQSPEESYRWVYGAAVQHRLIAALYDGKPRLLCPHVLGYNQPGEWRVFCYQCGGETRSEPLPTESAGIWRCLSLKKFSRVELLDGPWRSEPHARQRRAENIEVDTEDYPDGDPQNGQ